MEIYRDPDICSLGRRNTGHIGTIATSPRVPPRNAKRPAANVTPEEGLATGCPN